MPVAFVSHGAPTLALDSRRGAQLRAWGDALPPPAAIVVVSSH
jgi:aromatic ring-opening dioxygenase catalytic subunit (LigB family)